MIIEPLSVSDKKQISFQLKLELESLELEGKLRLAKLEAKFLQSKTELLYD